VYMLLVAALVLAMLDAMTVGCVVASKSGTEVPSRVELPGIRRGVTGPPACQQIIQL
jgi:hypothetical protein